MILSVSFVSFYNYDEQLVLNKTNAKRIAHLHGDDTRNWLAKEVTLISEAVDFRGEIAQAVRVSLNPPQPAPPPSPVGLLWWLRRGCAEFGTAPAMITSPLFSSVPVGI